MMISLLRMSSFLLGQGNFLLVLMLKSIVFGVNLVLVFPSSVVFPEDLQSRCSFDVFVVDELAMVQRDEG